MMPVLLAFFYSCPRANAAYSLYPRHLVTCRKKRSIGRSHSNLSHGITYTTSGSLDSAATEVMSYCLLVPCTHLQYSTSFVTARDASPGCVSASLNVFPVASDLPSWPVFAERLDGCSVFSHLRISLGTWPCSHA